MAKKLFFDPPVLYRWLPKSEQTQVVFLDVEPDIPEDKSLRFDLNILFLPIALKRGFIQKRDFYVGSTGASIEFETFGGKVKSYTQQAALKVDYESTLTRSRKAALKIAPAVETEAGAKVSGGEVSFDKDVAQSFTTKVSGSEKWLTEVSSTTGIVWDLTAPDRGAIRDYLIGNLFLYVESSWTSGKPEGRIVVRPSNVLFFDANRRRIDSNMKTLMMKFALWRNDIEVDYQEIEVNYKEDA